MNTAGTLGVLGTAFALSAAANAITIPAAKRLGFMDFPGGRKGHSTPVPLGGGIAVFLSTLAAFGLYASRLGGAETHKYSVFFAAAGIICLLGALDDIRPIRPWVKLAVEAGAALLLYAAGFRITAFVYSPVVNMLLTVGWMVVITNAFNLLDSTDGLSSGTALIVAAMALFGLHGRLDPGPFLLLAATAGSAAGFLLHNFPPARLFLGDAGSLFLGFSLAAATADATFYSREWKADPLLAMAAPLLLFAVPLYDTLSVMLIRVREGRSILTGDRSHLPHRLLALGLNKREALFLILLVAALSGAAASYVPYLSRSQAVLVLLQVWAMFVVMFILERAGGRKR